MRSKVEGLEKLKAGDFNDMMQERQLDGSVIITLSKRGEDRPVKFRVRDLYGPGKRRWTLPQVNLLLKEIYQKLCPGCQEKVRKLVKDKLDDEAIKEELEGKDNG